MWHFLLPTWLIEIKANIPYGDDQKLYTQHVQRSGYQPHNIKIDTPLQITAFFKTIAVSFEMGVKYYTEKPDKQLHMVVINPRKSKLVLHISSRGNMQQQNVYEGWVEINSITQEYMNMMQEVSTTRTIILPGDVNLYIF